MSNDENVCFTPEQLIYLINSFYSHETQNRYETEQMLSKWVQSPSSMPTAFEIIRSSSNEKLRFFAACSFHYLITNNIHYLSSENVFELVDLFISFIINNQDRIDSPDTKAILTSLANIIGLFNNIIEMLIKALPREIFLILIGILTEELSNSSFIEKFNQNRQIDLLLGQMSDLIYNFFANSSFSLHWSQSFSKFFVYYKKPIYCLPFLDKIEKMTLDRSLFQSFLSIFYESFQLDFRIDESTFIFNTNLAKIAVIFIENNPCYASDIWTTIFDYPRSFLLSNSRIEFTEPLFQSFIQNLTIFCDESYCFNKILDSFASLISSPNNDAEFYPDELRTKHILTFIEALSFLYNERSSQRLGFSIEKVSNRFYHSKFSDDVKKYIISQQLSPGIFRLYNTQLFSEKDSEILNQVINSILNINEIPIEAIQFINSKIVCTDIVIPFLKQIIQLCMSMMKVYEDVSIETLKNLSDYHPQEMIHFSYDLSLSLLPFISNFQLNNQVFLILLFFNILTPDDSSKLMIIKEQILQECKEAVQSSDLTKVKNMIVFVSNLYCEFSMIENQFFVEFMTQLFPLIFHELVPISMTHNVQIQDCLCLFIKNASERCIVLPQIEDQEQKLKALIESEMYHEIFQWLFSIMSQCLCGGHFTVLTSFEIHPFNEIFQIISQIGPNDNSQIIQKMLDYIEKVYSGNSEQLWPVIHPHFFILFLNSKHLKVVISTLHFLRKIIITSNEIKMLAMQAVACKMAMIEWLKNDFLIFESIKTLCVLINQSKEMFDNYVQIMSSLLPRLDYSDDYFQKIWDISKSNIVNIETMKYSTNFSQIKESLFNIIFLNRSV
ncbi:hypothetical protein M9Y10_029463 [Tritrichomonas musculus]|uniref:Importin N-terminal domain-containing protein n=1 Tax=Tritrichomonas musculus TaxID=1915356 RepID=A0ABR2KM94_9EUKA